MPFDPSGDGDTVEVDMTVEDVMGNTFDETVKVGFDSSPPILDQSSARFQENTRKQIGGIDHFTSRSDFLHFLSNQVFI